MMVRTRFANTASPRIDLWRSRILPGWRSTMSQVVRVVSSRRILTRPEEQDISPRTEPSEIAVALWVKLASDNSRQALQAIGGL